MSPAARAGHQAALVAILALTVTLFGGVEPWARPSLGLLVGLLSLFLAWCDGRRPPWPLLAPLMVAIVLGLLATAFPGGPAGPADYHPSAASPERSLSASAYLVATMLALWASAALFRGQEGLRRAGNALVAVACFLILLAAALRASGTHKLLGILSYTWGNPFGPILNYNHAADILILAIPVAISRAAAPPDARMVPSEYWARRLVLVFPALFLFGGLLATSSRGAAIFLAIALAAWGLVRLRGSSRWGAVAVAAALPFAVLVRNALFNPARAGFFDDSTSIRFAMWRGALTLLADKPLFGVGAGGVYGIFEPYRPSWMNLAVDHVHCEPLEWLLEYGVLGGGLIAIASVLAVRKFRRLWQVAEAAPRAAALPLLVGLGAVATHQLVDFSLRIPAVAFIFVLACGAVWGGLMGESRSLLHRRGAAPVLAAIAFIVLLYEGVPAGMAGYHEARHRYEKVESQRPALERALAWRDSANYHRRASMLSSANDAIAERRAALAHVQQALSLEPLSGLHRGVASQVLLRMGRTEDAQSLSSWGGGSR